VIYRLGPQAQRILDALRDQITSGQLKPGDKIPSHTVLATEYSVAPLTVRHALAHLEDEGWIIREQGRGTFVQTRLSPRVLIVDDDEDIRAILNAHITTAGYETVTASNPISALELLEGDSSIALVLSDVRMPDTSDGVEFIRHVRQRWPALPLAALTGYPADLNALHGTPEWPVLILSKPFYPQQIMEALRFTLGSRTPPLQ
jgi:CheY-like chemotaxis protein